MTDDEGLYPVGLTAEVPRALVRWVQRRCRLDERAAKQLIRRTLRVHVSLLMKSVEVIDEASGDPLLTIVANWDRAPREGGRWFDCGTRRGRRMTDGVARDDEEDGDGAHEGRHDGHG